MLKEKILRHLETRKNREKREMKERLADIEPIARQIEAIKPGDVIVVHDSIFLVNEGPEIGLPESRLTTLYQLVTHKFLSHVKIRAIPGVAYVPEIEGETTVIKKQTETIGLEEVKRLFPDRQIPRKFSPEQKFELTTGVMRIKYFADIPCVIISETLTAKSADKYCGARVRFMWQEVGTK